MIKRIKLILKGWQMDINEARKIVNDKVQNYKDIVSDKQNPTKSSSDENHPVSDHTHKFKRGVLPGQKYIRQCACGVFEPVSYAEWQNIA